MFSQRQIYFTMAFILFFSACSVKDTNTTSPIKITKIEEIKKKKIKKPKKIEKEVQRKVPKKTQIKKKIYIYKYCNKHSAVMNYASSYIQEEFNNAYFIKKDLIGAKAQLFLIESDSQTIFAKNINNAIKSYDQEYLKAKKNRCNLKKFSIHPLEKIRIKLKKNENAI